MSGGTTWLPRGAILGLSRWDQIASHVLHNLLTDLGNPIANVDSINLLKCDVDLQKPTELSQQ